MRRWLLMDPKMLLHLATDRGVSIYTARSGAGTTCLRILKFFLKA